MSKCKLNTTTIVIIGVAVAVAVGAAVAVVATRNRKYVCESKVKGGVMGKSCPDYRDKDTCQKSSACQWVEKSSG